MAAIGTGGNFKFEVEGLSAAFQVARFEGDEAISRLYAFHLQLTSEDRDIAFADVIGKPALLTLATEGLEDRHVHGIVSRFEQGEEGKKAAGYLVTLVPSVWRLQHRHDLRIFQEQTVPDIIKAVLGKWRITAFDLRLSEDHPVREYCVQYRESDWAFLSRLMEEEGIAYFFEHHPDKETLVLGDASHVFNPIAGSASLAFRTPLGAMAHGESVSRFSLAEEVRPGKVSLTDFNFKKPKLSLDAADSAPDDLDLEVYDYPGEYDVPADGTALAKVRLEELRAVRQVGDGDSGVMRFTSGFLFTLIEHLRDGSNGKYLLTRVQHRGMQPTMGEAAGTEGPTYSNRFQVIPAAVPFRPARTTPRPTVKGVQSAIVVGPAGEEIYTDKYGRVKVQFHWDRLGKHDETSSCWIRVSQLWAGAGWGAMFVPRIGHEVLVDFLEGDPDRPIIVGRVYHGANLPPYPLPGEQTKSTIKSNSSPGGDGSNELRFEDQKGREEIFLHGQKDWNIKILNDKTQSIGHDERLTVDHDRKKEIKHDQTELVLNNDTITVKADRAEKIGGNETVSIGKSAQRTVTADQSESVGASSTLSVGANASQAIGANMNLAVGGNKNEVVGGNAAVTAAGSLAVTSSGSYTLSVGDGLSAAVGKDHAENADGSRTMTVGKKLTMTVGEGVVTVEKDGTITITGKDITVKGDGTVTVQASKKIVLKSDGPVEVEAGGEVKLKGSAVNLN